MIQTIIFYSLASIGIAALLFLVWKLPKWQTKKIRDIDKNEKWKAENEFRKTLIQVFGGLVVIGGLYFAYQEIKNFHISQENMKAGQIASRFSQAIKFLGENNSTQNIGGIYALEQISKESPENYLGTALEVLSAFVRNQELKYCHNEWEEESYEIKPEIQIAMTVLGRIRAEENSKYWANLPWVNLGGTKLRGAKLQGANLARTYLSGANISGTNLKGANIREANLMRTNLTGANLMRADLTGADLTGANLMRADLTGADLTGADLMGATLTGANLVIADLTGADLRGADFTNAVNLRVEQLLMVKSLYKVKGLSPEIEKEIREKKPELIEKYILWERPA